MKKTIVCCVLAGLMFCGFSSTGHADPFIGEIKMFAGNFAPRGYAFCNGQLLSIASYSALFSLLGTTYGGDGVSTFGLPDLRGRVPIHHGSSPRLSLYYLGQKGGYESVTLNANQIPSHNHALNASDQGADSVSPEDATLSAKTRTKNYNQQDPNINVNTNSIGLTGGGQANRTRLLILLSLLRESIRRDLRITFIF